MNIATNKRTWLLGVAIVAVSLSSSFAEITLPKIIGNHMVLQRGVAAPVWGWADQGEEVTVRFAGQEKKAMPDATGKWMVRLDPLDASSEPREMVITGSNEIRLSDVLVGEVWLASGQSNMEWSLRQIAAEEQQFAQMHKDNDRVRAFHVEAHIMTGVPMDDTIGRWKKGADLHTASAVAFFFALKLQQELDVPVAYLDANWGGQRIELFIAEEGYRATGIPYRRHGAVFDLGQVAHLLDGAAGVIAASRDAARKGIRMPYAFANPFGHSDNGIYNGMIAPLVPYAIKGALWYQGESNRSMGDYFKKLQALSKGWSQVFGIADIPLHLVQIAPFAYNGGNPADNTLCRQIWAAQYRAAREVPGVGVIPIHDTQIDIRDIHPAHKRTVGERLAARSLKHQYGREVVATGPSFASARAESSKVVVSFRDIDQGLVTADGQAPSWFELSADGQTFAKADAVINGETVEVSSAAVPTPEFVRMGWYDIAIPNLKDGNGWPVFAFPAQAVE